MYSKLLRKSKSDFKMWDASWRANPTVGSKFFSLIVEEIVIVLPEVVSTLEAGDKTLDPNNLTWYLINAVQDLSAEVAKLKNG